MKTVEGVFLSFYYDNDESETFKLSPMQLATVIKILGFKNKQNDTYTCYSDDTLERFFSMEGNPLRLDTTTQP